MATWEDMELDSGVLQQASGHQVDGGNGAGQMAIAGHGLRRTGTQYNQAIAAVRPRDLERVVTQLTSEARLAGESFFYAWGSGKDRVLGPSVGLAMSAARLFGNCAVDMGDVQDLNDAWVFTGYFIDLETGFTNTRQFRQSKAWTIFGNFDAERKDDMRFQIGQSKCTRNLVINSLPPFLIKRALQAAQKGVRERIEKFIEKKGLPAAVDLAVQGLAGHGVREADILAKCAKAHLDALDVDDIVLLRGDLYALDERQDRAEALYPTMDTADTSEQQTETDAALEGQDAGQREVVPEKAKVEQEKAKPKPAKPKASKPAKPKTKPKPKQPQPQAETPQETPEPPEQQTMLGTDPEPPEGEGVLDTSPDDADVPVSDSDISDTDATQSDTDATPADSQPELQPGEIPPDFMPRLAQCKSITAVDGLMTEWEGQVSSSEVMDAMTEMAEMKKNAIRMARSG